MSPRATRRIVWAILLASQGVWYGLYTVERRESERKLAVIEAAVITYPTTLPQTMDSGGIRYHLVSTDWRFENHVPHVYEHYESENRAIGVTINRTVAP